jgi:hypothetical protein
MVVQRHTKHPGVRTRVVSAVAGSALALASLAILAAPGLAANSIAVGAGGTTIVANGTTISTSNLTLAQLAKLQGVPASTVGLELDGVAAGTPAASAVDALVTSLPAEATLATALDELSSASGGLISPQTALRLLVQDEGQPGASGGNGSNGGSGTGVNGSPGANASVASGVSPKTSFTLRVTSPSLKGRPGSRVRVSYTVSSAAKLSYGGNKLAQGSRNIRSGAGVLTVKLPRRHGTYRLTLKAVSATEGKSAQASVMLNDSQVKVAKKSHH